MKSYVKDFAYISEKHELKNRKIIVMNETEDKIEGFDLNYLKKKDREAAIKLLCGKHNVHDWISSRPSLKTHNIEGLNPKWFKAWRLFKKDNIQDDIVSIDALANMFIEKGFTKTSNIKYVKRNIYKALQNKDVASAYGIRIFNVEENYKLLHVSKDIFN